jgi:hypothetical protein
MVLPALTSGYQTSYKSSHIFRESRLPRTAGSGIVAGIPSRAWRGTPAIDTWNSVPILTIPLRSLNSSTPVSPTAENTYGHVGVPATIGRIKDE